MNQVEDDSQRFGVGDLLRIVDRRALEIGGDAALADASVIESPSITGPSGLYRL